MMRACVCCVGRVREPGYALALAEYQKRLSRYLSLEICEAPDLPEPDTPSPALEARVKTSEGTALCRFLKPGDHVIALTLDGTKYTSDRFAKKLDALCAAGAGRLVFVIGGSLGLGDNILAHADERLSLSDMTLPHQLARVFLLEQLYRAQKILHHERYHK